MSTNYEDVKGDTKFIYLFYLFSNTEAKRPHTVCIRTSNKISKLYIKLLKKLNMKYISI